jgi:hypothetical protein
VHIQAGKPNKTSATLQAADAQNNHKYDAFSTTMGYKFFILTAPRQNFREILCPLSQRVRRTWLTKLQNKP